MRFLMVVITFLAVGLAAAQTNDPGKASVAAEEQVTAWTPLEFLVGTWTGEGAGNPGNATGGFSFKWALQQKVLIRESNADYPATKDRPAVSHQDMTMVYEDPATKRLKAIYFDNEGHVINYTITVSQGMADIIFQGEVNPGSPVYRLTYTKTGSATLKLKFEIAAPEKPQVFVTYVEGLARRR